MEVLYGRIEFPAMDLKPHPAIQPASEQVLERLSDLSDPGDQNLEAEDKVDRSCSLCHATLPCSFFIYLDESKDLEGKIFTELCVICRRKQAIHTFKNSWLRGHRHWNDKAISKLEEKQLQALKGWHENVSKRGLLVTEEEETYIWREIAKASSPNSSQENVMRRQSKRAHTTRTMRNAYLQSNNDLAHGNLVDEHEDLRSQIKDLAEAFETCGKTLNEGLNGLWDTNDLKKLVKFTFREPFEVGQVFEWIGLLQGLSSLAVSEKVHKQKLVDFFAEEDQPPKRRCKDV